MNEEELVKEKDWNYISKYQKLSEDFIEKYQDKINWICISVYQKLSEKFIEKYQDKVNWYYISQYQKLSEGFIEKHQGKVDWYYISQFQRLSEGFIEKYQNKIYWTSLCSNENILINFFNFLKFSKTINWNIIFEINYKFCKDNIPNNHFHNKSKCIWCLKTLKRYQGIRYCPKCLK